MAYTPVELRHVTLKTGLRGYRKDSVDRLLADVAESFEDVWRERADLADRIEQLEAELTRRREQEALLSNTLLAAERSAADQKEAAHRQAEQVVAEAHAESRSIARSAIADREKLLGEVRRVRSLLRSALDIVDEGDREPEEHGEGYPAREDTREFGNPQRPGLYLSSEPRDASA